MGNKIFDGTVNVFLYCLHKCIIIHTVENWIFILTTHVASFGNSYSLRYKWEEESEKKKTYQHNMNIECLSRVTKHEKKPKN